MIYNKIRDKAFYNDDPSPMEREGRHPVASGASGMLVVIHFDRFVLSKMWLASTA